MVWKPSYYNLRHAERAKPIISARIVTLLPDTVPFVRRLGSDAAPSATQSEKWIMKWILWLWGQRRGGKINVSIELIDNCALPTSVYEDEGPLIKSKTKKRW